MSEHVPLQHGGQKNRVASPNDTQIHAPTDFTLNGHDSPQQILRLQAAIGNQAVQCLLAKHPAANIQKTTPATPRIQRADIGLEQPALMSDFVAQGYAYWQEPANKDKPLADFAAYLVSLANTALSSFGVPQVNHAMTDSGAYGTFNKFEWMIYFNAVQVSNENSIQTVGGLSQEQAANFAGIAYHEARHAEQAFRVARLLAGQGKDAATITADALINAATAEEAVKTPLTNTPETAEEFAEAQEWEKIWGGVHGNYQVRFSIFGTKAFAVWERLNKAKEADFAACMTELSSFMASVHDEEAPFVSSEFDRVANIDQPTADDNLIFEMLMKVDSAIKVVLEHWETAKTATNLTGLKTFEPALDSLWQLLFHAYEAFPHEKDAWAVGGAAGEQFKNMGTPGSQTAPAP